MNPLRTRTWARGRQPVSPASHFSTGLLLDALSTVRGAAGGALLDVGCGAKPYRGFFQARSHLGVDWPRSVHASCADCHASADALPFSDSTFDTVLCTEVLEHVASPSRVVGEAARVLREDGSLILSAPFVHEPHERPFDYYRFSRDGLMMLVTQAGLEPVRVLSRGGAFAVICDLLIRAIHRGVRRACRGLGLPSFATGWLVKGLVIAPQVLLLAFVRRVGLGATECTGMESRGITLGYVLLARRGGRIPHGEGDRSA